MKTLNNFFAFFAVLFFPLICLGADILNDCPKEYKALYQELEGQIDSFSSKMHAGGDSIIEKPIFSASLLTANAHRGRQLLEPKTYQGVLLELRRLKDLGIQGVVVSVGFPILYRPFYGSDEEYNGYLNFYKKLGEDVHAQGLSYIIESGAIFSKGGFSGSEKQVAKFYKKLTIRGYARARAEMISTVAKELSPDYLVVGNEPDTEADQTGKFINNPVIYAKIIKYIVNTVNQKTKGSIPIGAGIGTWNPKYKEFIENFCRMTKVDFIDIHIYPIGRDFLERAVEIAEISKKWNKFVTISEAWLYKASNKEIGKGVTANEIFDRDNFSFWEPLDSKFMAVLVKFAKVYRLRFISFFWSRYFYAYVDYGEAKGLLPQEINRLRDQKIVANMVAGAYTKTAENYSRQIKE